MAEKMSVPRVLMLRWSSIAEAIRKVYCNVKALLPWRALLVTLSLLLLLHLFGLMYLPFWPFTTSGTIYVDSPEVYTRERLVNDRYDQDYWLRRQLESLERVGTGALVERHIKETARAEASDLDVEPPTDADAAVMANYTDMGLTFEQRFRIVSGVRDMIRQQLLENMLDDRHDLAGNSLYGLKFDTTVLPGSNTRRRAYVQVTVTLDDLFAPSPPNTTPAHLRTHFRRICEHHDEAVLDCGGTEIDDRTKVEHEERFARQTDHYNA